MVVGRRERKKQETRAALSDAAVRLSLAHGIENVTAEHIADAADVSLRTFFNYFSGKEEAVVAGDAARGEVLVERFTARPASESVLTALRAAVLAHVDDVIGDDRRDELRMLRRSPSLLPHQLAAYAAGERALAVAVGDRTGERDGLYPALVAATVIAGVRVAVARWADGPVDDRDRTAMHGAVGEMFDVLARGLDDR